MMLRTRRGRPLAPLLVPAFTLVELLVVIGIIAVLISILIPTLSKARMSANTVKCLSNLRQLANANSMYASQWKGWAVPNFVGNNNDVFPGTTTKVRAIWLNNNPFRRNLNVQPWIVENGVGNGKANHFPDGMVCPEATRSREQSNKHGATMQFSYGYNCVNQNYTGAPVVLLPPGAAGADLEFRGIKYNRVRRPSDKIMFADAMTPHIRPQESDFYYKVATYDDNKDDDDENGNGTNSANYVAYRHSKDKKSNAALINIVFWDAHATTMKRGEVVATKDQSGNAAAANRTPVWELHWDLGAK